MIRRRFGDPLDTDDREDDDARAIMAFRRYPDGATLRRERDHGAHIPSPPASAGLPLNLAAHKVNAPLTGRALSCAQVFGTPGSSVSAIFPKLEGLDSLA